ncbi:imm11 family protein [Sphingomonas astaxanthinifaciens]|uniref:Immunity MXAN-0049 protein domain-containing protein n=1 Tax=Sphingomonas astaxanthinifaciens DSM 22298 TaxID=1123267 RepID=A0ABQ5Z556_9SPHN|nr:DUF1629 domain-containing protein [Sphingomonas astaxanthinifaciens]GLR47130.1 hypothetical protein GCM10007925_08410 [Sphingomonas astaxanthinifaciens DSM 22298]
MPYGLNVSPVNGHYVSVEAIDGAIDQVSLEDETPDGGYPPRGRPLSAGRPVRTEHLPTRMRWLGREGHAIPDFDNGLVLNVSAKAKALIEELEPGIHQFVEVSYENASGQHLERRYFLFVGNRLDSMHPDNPTMALNRGMYWVPLQDLIRRGQPIPADKSPEMAPKIVLSADQIGHAHLWVDSRSAGGATFVSDRFVDAVRDRGLTGLKPSAIETW